MNNLETNAAEVYKRFEDLSYKEMRKALKSGLKTALRAIRKAGVENLKAKIKNTNKVNPKYNDTLQKGIRVTRVWENQNGDIVGTVLSSSNRRTGSGSFRLQILESGSYKVGERFVKSYNGKPLKKAKSAGVLKPSNFFKKTIDEKDGYYQSTMKAAIEKAVDKINQTL